MSFTGFRHHFVNEGAAEVGGARQSPRLTDSDTRNYLFETQDVEVRAKCEKAVLEAVRGYNEVQGSLFHISPAATSRADTTPVTLPHCGHGASASCSSSANLLLKARSTEASVVLFRTTR